MQMMRANVFHGLNDIALRYARAVKSACVG